MNETVICLVVLQMRFISILAVVSPACDISCAIPMHIPSGNLISRALACRVGCEEIDNDIKHIDVSQL